MLHSLPVCAALLEVRDVPTLLAWHLANKASVAALSRSEPLHCSRQLTRSVWTNSCGWRSHSATLRASNWRDWRIRIGCSKSGCPPRVSASKDS